MRACKQHAIIIYRAKVFYYLDGFSGLGSAPVILTITTMLMCWVRPVRRITIGFLTLTASVLRFTQPITKIGSSSIRTIDKQFAGSRYEMKGLIVLLFNIKGQNKPNLFVTAMLLQNELEKVVRLFFLPKIGK